MKDALRAAAKRAALLTPWLHDVVAERDWLRSEVARLKAEHLHSPMSLDELRHDERPIDGLGEVANPEEIDVELGRDWPEPASDRSRSELEELVRSLGWWYHRIYLGQGVYTIASPGLHDKVWRRVRTAFPGVLRGASVLDIGCNAGFFSLHAKLRGAARMLGIDSEPLFLQQAQACRAIWNLDIEYRQLDAHELGNLHELFDLVIFTGVLYHLRNPFRVLEEVARLCRDAVVVETEVILDDPGNRVYVRQGPQGQVTVRECRTGFMKFIEGSELNSDPSNWWVPDTACVQSMLRAVGFTHFSTACYPEQTRLLLVASKRAESLLDLRAVK